MNMYIIFLLIILLLMIVISWLFQNIKWKRTILKFIKEVFIALLSFSGSLARVPKVSDYRKYISISKQ